MVNQNMLALYRSIGPDVDVPAGDMGVGTREIGCLVEMRNSGRDRVRDHADKFGVNFYIDEA